MKQPDRWRDRFLARFGARKDELPSQQHTKAIGIAPFFAVHGLAAAGWSGTGYAPLSREGYMRNAVVHRCVRMIAETMSAVPWIAYENGDELADHPALDLVRQPNGMQPRRQFFEKLAGHLLLSGNAYVEAVAGEDDRLRLFTMRPDQVDVEIDERGWPSAYVHRVNNRKRRIALDASARLAPVLHLTLFNPLDDVQGFPPLQAAMMALDVHNSATRWNKALLDNSARPSGALVYAPADKSSLTDEQFQSLKRELEEGYSGASGAGRPLLLEGGMDWKSMSLSPRDMDFIEARNAAARDIALAFGVPPMLLGIPGDNTYANYQEANRAFFRLTVMPLLAMVTEGFSHWLAPHFGGNISYAADLDQVDNLSAERESLWARLENASFLTQAEKREAVGYSPEPGGVIGDE